MFFIACALFLIFTAGATPADVFAASMIAELFQSTYLQIMLSTSIGGSLNPQPSMLQRNALNHSTTPVRPRWRELYFYGNLLKILDVNFVQKCQICIV